MICSRPGKRGSIVQWTSALASLLYSTVACPPADAGGRHAQEYSIENPKYHSMVVARVGSRSITAREFLLSYTFGPAFPKRVQHSKQEYLNYMIYEKLLALDGYKHRIDTTEDARISLAEMEGDLATEELYRQDVLRKVKVGEKAIQRGTSQEGITCSVQWMYARSRASVEAQVEALKKGVSFDSLFRLQFADTAVKPDDRSMEATRFRIGMRNPQLAAVLDTLPAHHVSSPIATADGWYLVRLSGVERSVITTQTQEEKLREDVQRALVQHSADSLSDLYVQRLLKGAHPVIVRRTLDILHVHLAKIMLPAARFDAWGLVRRLIDRWGPVQYENVDPALPLVEAKGVKLTARDVLRWYRAREENLKFSLTSPEAMYASLEGYIWQMVRDKLLTARALQRGLQHTPRVQEQLGWWKDKIVYNIVKARLADALHPADDTLRTYYRQHLKEFRDTSGTALPFERAKDDVLRAWYAFETTKITLHRILKLKEEYRITVNDDKLNGLYVDTENNPGAIDVYVVKPGGIFPRPAFPTIDYGWQAWN